jgi:hypothetical protein
VALAGLAVAVVQPVEAPGGASVLVVLGDGRGGFLPNACVSIEPAPNDVFPDGFLAADFDADDRDDLLVTVRSSRRRGDTGGSRRDVHAHGRLGVVRAARQGARRGRHRAISTGTEPATSRPRTSSRRTSASCSTVGDHRLPSRSADTRSIHQ